MEMYWSKRNQNHSKIQKLGLPLIKSWGLYESWLRISSYVWVVPLQEDGQTSTLKGVLISVTFNMLFRTAFREMPQ